MDLNNTKERREGILNEINVDISNDYNSENGTNQNIVALSKSENELQNKNPSSEINRIPLEIIDVQHLDKPSNINQAETKKEDSIVTILALWNMMTGSSLLIIPWAINRSGLVFSVVVFLVITMISFYTAYLIVQSQVKVTRLNCLTPDFNAICKIYLGNVGSFICFSMSISILFSVGIVYYILTTNFLYSTVDFIYELSTNQIAWPSILSTDAICFTNNEALSNYTLNQEFTNKTSVIYDGYNTSFQQNVKVRSYKNDVYHKIWTQQTSVPLFLVIILFPLINIKSPNFFTRFDALGVISILYMIFFVTFKSINWGFHFNFTTPFHISYISMSKWTFPTLSGILLMAFFIHNAVLSILELQKKPENNHRDLIIAFCLGGFTLVYVGIMFNLSYPLSKDCIADNLFNNLPTTDILSFLGRLFFFIQLITVFPLFSYILRKEIFKRILCSVYPGRLHTLFLNTLMMTCFVLLAIFYPKVGNIARYLGSICGLGYIFILPLLVRLFQLRRENQLRLPIVFLHAALILIGIVNCIAQFLI